MLPAALNVGALPGGVTHIIAGGVGAPVVLGAVAMTIVTMAGWLERLDRCQLFSGQFIAFGSYWARQTGHLILIRHIAVARCLRFMRPEWPLW